ncbi:aminoglycoside 6-adenylyltransferase [Salipaludibacillus agaradhaerens]|uniref:aminoglycoside 6-adenylyltransferase n=1 Tax=Salipaludibacillus agaradhaerens TaxID=76935 RepID=UPI000996AFCB|nr:aminoglycoside 6-adenylyltransferase [Salipaludibacillus agaradhaerens]
MRNEQEMFELIISVAKNDERIRAVYMNGSRTNPNVPKDIFQDYDIVYVVTDTSSFIKDEHWIEIYGDVLMKQEPDKLEKGKGLDANFERTYAYLMLFTDGNRIDLRIQTAEAMLEEYGEDKLTIPLLDKDAILPSIPPPSDLDYHVNKPTEGQYDSCTNNFWWCLQNVAKGIRRDELPYSKLMFEYTTRVALDEMVNWWIGIENDFQVSTGKMGKYFKKYLPESYWEMYINTYSDSDYENMWQSVFIACKLFRILSHDVANHFHFSYPVEDDNNMTKYLRHLRDLPANAKEIF